MNGDSEGDHLSEIYDDYEDYSTESYEDFREMVRDGVKEDEYRYKLNKQAKVGTSIVCAGPKCNNRFTKKILSAMFLLHTS